MFNRSSFTVYLYAASEKKASAKQHNNHEHNINTACQLPEQELSMVHPVLKASTAAAIGAGRIVSEITDLAHTPVGSVLTLPGTT